MKLIIAGSRIIHKEGALALFDDWLAKDDMILEDFILGCELVSGCAKGPDQVPFLVQNLYPETVVTKFAADWNTYGKSAGPKRNKQMAEYADALLLIWDGESKGSANMKRNMERLGKPIYEIIV